MSALPHHSRVADYRTCPCRWLETCAAIVTRMRTRKILFRTDFVVTVAASHDAESNDRDMAAVVAARLANEVDAFEVDIDLL